MTLALRHYQFARAATKQIVSDFCLVRTEWPRYGLAKDQVRKDIDDWLSLLP